MCQMWDAANSLLEASRGTPDDQLTPKADVRDESYKIKKICEENCMGLVLPRTSQNWPIQPSKVDEHQVSQSTLSADTHFHRHRSYYFFNLLCGS